MRTHYCTLTSYNSLRLALLPFTRLHFFLSIVHWRRRLESCFFNIFVRPFYWHQDFPFMHLMSISIAMSAAINCVDPHSHVGWLHILFPLTVIRFRWNNILEQIRGSHAMLSLYCLNSDIELQARNTSILMQGSCKFSVVLQWDVAVNMENQHFCN